jgi:hypothetical protein
MMMPPAVVMASIPSIVVTSATMMAPTVAMPVPVSTLHLNDCGVAAGKHIRMDPRQCRCRQSRSKCKSADSKPDQRKPLHNICPPSSAQAQSSVMHQSVQLFHGSSARPRIRAAACDRERGGFVEYVQTSLAIRLNLDKLPRLYRGCLKARTTPEDAVSAPCLHQSPDAPNWDISARRWRQPSLSPSFLQGPPMRSSRFGPRDHGGAIRTGTGIITGTATGSPNLKRCRTLNPSTLPRDRSRSSFRSQTNGSLFTTTEH